MEVLSLANDEKVVYMLCAALGLSCSARCYICRLTLLAGCTSICMSLRKTTPKHLALARAVSAVHLEGLLQSCLTTTARVPLPTAEPRHWRQLWGAGGCSSSSSSSTAAQWRLAASACCSAAAARNSATVATPQYSHLLPAHFPAARLASERHHQPRALRSVPAAASARRHRGWAAEWRERWSRRRPAATAAAAGAGKAGGAGAGEAAG